MCYHVSTAPQKELSELAKAKHLTSRYEGQNYYHVSGFARPFLPTIVNDDPTSISESRWKLLPFWVKTEDEAKRYANTLNAKSEELFEKKSYSPYIMKHRGLLLVDGFYEPHTVVGQKETDNYYLSMPGHRIFAIGIVVAPWTDKATGEHYNTFSVITTPANELLTEIHNVKKRMPLIIPEDKWSSWLNADTKPEIQNLMQPLEDGILQGWKVGRVTGARGEDTNLPDIQKPI